MANTTVIGCKCSHPFQDREYGKGRRLHNVAPGNDGRKTNRWRCTVCGDTQEQGGLQESRGKKD